MSEKAKILIVDDDVSMCETLSDILEEKGYYVAVAQDGPEAIEGVENQRFDLALIDIVMPGMNGVEVLRQIKAIDPQVTTMVMTGHAALGESISDALEAGADGILYKPLDIDAIVEMITGRAEAPDLPRVDLKRYKVQPEALRLIPEAIARKYDLIPLRIEGDSLVLAMADPDNLYAIEDVRVLSRMRVKVLRAPLMDIRGAINLHYRAMGEIERQISYIAPALPERMEAEERVTADLIAQAPVVRAVDLLIAQAVKDRASDIHIEPQKDHLRIRYRIDGILHDTLSLPLSVHGPLISRVKVLADMNIAERRRPQDGHFTVSIDGREVDIRVATADTSWGEMAVLRVLDKSISVMGLSELGFLPDSLETYQKLIQSPFGMILVSGPTGAGKTTTLYATINQLDAEERNIMTIEDPIEYRFTNVNQMQVNPHAGITFANGLRSIMRLDPDIILVGEMRDRETVNATFQAALTGHLVLTTLHTLDVVQTISRIIDFYPDTMQKQGRIMLSETMKAIVSMRLLPQVGGGRLPAMEIMKTTGRIREFIEDPEKTELIKLAMEEGEDEGMITFDRYLLKLYKEGRITYETALAAATSQHDFKLLEQKETDFTDKVMHRVEQYGRTEGGSTLYKGGL